MIQLGLQRISALVLRGQQQRWKAVHIAGTNGKGSVAAYVAALFLRPQHDGQVLKVGRFTSPHLVDRWDGIEVDGRPGLSRETFAEIEGEVRERDAQGKIGATEFEILTAVAWEVFGNVDVGVVECGVGGARDATNVLRAQDVLVSVVTKVGLDHQDLLGRGLRQIALEKAGIIKPGVPVVVDGTNGWEVRSVMLERAREMGAEVFFTADEGRVVEEVGLDADGLGERGGGLAPHQKTNLAVALKAFEVAGRRLREMDSKWSHTTFTTPSPPQLADIVRHVADTWQARLQRISIHSITGRSTEVLLDGAHNAQSAGVLGQYVDDLIRGRENKPVTWVIGMSKGKDMPEILRPLLRYGDSLVACQFGPVDGMPWVAAQDPSEICGAAERILQKQHSRHSGKDLTQQAGEMRVHEYPWTAVGEASLIAGEDRPIVIAGSLYLCSDVLRLLRDPPASLESQDVERWMQKQLDFLKKRKAGIFE